MDASSIHNQFMELALAEAHAALKENEVPVGCVIVKNGVVICKEHNRTNAMSDPLAHAEFIAFKSILNDGFSNKEEYTLYVTVEPCVMCNGILKRMNIKVYFGCYNEIFGTKKLTGMNAGECIINIKCIEVLQEFYTRENMIAPPDKRINKEKRKKKDTFQ